VLQCYVAEPGPARGVLGHYPINSRASHPDSVLTIALISAGSAVLGAAVVAAQAVVTTWLTERSRRRRHRTELAFQAAIEQYKADQALALEISSRESGTFRQYPLDDYLIGMAKLVRALDDNVSDEELAHVLDARKRSLATARDRYQTTTEAGMEEAARQAARRQPPPTGGPPAAP
jgi:hypothetical protein